MNTAAEMSDTEIAAEWHSLVAPLGPIGAKMLSFLPENNDEVLRTELYQLLFSQIVAGYVGRVYNDPDYPEFAPMYNSIMNQGFPNPDDSIYLTPIRDVGVYRISGVRGTVRYVTFQIGSGTAIPYGMGSLGRSIADYNIDSLTLSPDGAFDVILSASRPIGYLGDWWMLDVNATYIVVRQRAYDWLTEVDGRFSIERIDFPAAKKRKRSDELRSDLASIPEWIETFAAMCLDGPFVKHLRPQGLINKVATRNYAATSGHAHQLYTEGIFDLKDDQALIIESTIPKTCTYWGFQLADEMWRSIDWIHRHSSLNGFTARPDRDGKLRIIIAKADPGVLNWLDTVDRNVGMIYGRWSECDTEPEIITTTVESAQVRRHLPPETKTISPLEREEHIRLRRKGAQMRRRW